MAAPDTLARKRFAAGSTLSGPGGNVPSCDCWCSGSDWDCSLSPEWWHLFQNQITASRFQLLSRVKIRSQDRATLLLIIREKKYNQENIAALCLWKDLGIFESALHKAEEEAQ